MRLPWRRDRARAGPGAPARGRSSPDGAPGWARRSWLRRLVAVLAVFGIFSVVGTALSLFSFLGRRPAAVQATTRHALDSEAFLTALAGATASPVRTGGRAQLLNNGDQIWPAMLGDIRRATESVDFMVYIWEEGRASRMVTDALVERANAGVQVRVLLDGLGAMKAPDEDLDRMRAAGVRVATFRPLRVGLITRFHRRNHRRAIVVDGDVGYTGGAAVGDKWLGNARTPESWRDEMVRVTGPPARSLQAAFAQIWSGLTGEILAGETFYPPAPAATGGGLAITRHVNVVSSPAPDAHPLRKVFWMSIASSQRRLWITNPYFVPDGHLRTLLAERAQAGVDVRVLVPDGHTDAAVIRWASQRHYEELLRSGVRIWEYGGTMLHTKSLVADGTWSVVGSANMDVRSKELNEENVLGIQDADFAAQLEKAFVGDLARAKEIRVETWGERGWWPRTREWVAAVFEEQY